MLLLSAINGNNKLNSERVTDEYLNVNSCGHFKITSPTVGQKREQGRVDYQLIYIYKGSATFLLEGSNKEVSEGNIVIYKPFQPQIYKYSGNNSEIFWIHFTGTAAGELLKKYGMWDHQVYFTGKLACVNEIIPKIINEINLRQSRYEDICGTYLLEMLIGISRQIEILRLYNSHGKKRENILDSIRSIHDEYNSNKSIDDYAKQCYMSKFRYLHLFKEHTGISPHAYKINIRIDKAKEYLYYTSISIAEIADIVGYSNPFNFSGIFKKHTGQSPLSYRKSLN